MPHATKERAGVLVGIDVHVAHHTAAIARWDQLAAGLPWTEVPVLRVTNTRADYDALTAAIAATGGDLPVLAVLDRTGTAYSAALAAHLRRAGCAITWLDPQQAKADRKRYRTGGKDDITDARIALWGTYDRLAHPGPKPVHVDITDPDLDDRATEIRALLTLHKQADRECTRQTNRLRQLATRAWPEVAANEWAAWSHVAHLCPTPAFLRRPAQPLPAATARRLAALIPSVGDPAPHLAEAITLTASALHHARGQLAGLASRLHTATAAHPYYPILSSFPALGLGHAAAIIATVTDVRRLDGPKAMRKMCGYDGVRWQSGDTDRTKAPVRKPRAKAALFLSVLVQLRADKEGRPTAYTRVYRRRRARGRHHWSAAYGAAGLMAEHIWHALANGEMYRQAPAAAANASAPAQ